MTKPESAAVIRVSAERISTADDERERVREEVGVVRETALTIDVGGVDAFTLLCSPNDTLALAAGFLCSEGIIASMDELARLEPCADDADVIRARLVRETTGVGEPGRNLLITSSCGACGSEHLDVRLAALPKVGDHLRLEASVLRRVTAAVRAAQVLFSACGGTHAAGLFDATGALLTSAEDTGRHNALDKAIGMRLLAGESAAGCGVVLSGRVSLEMVGKCARAGIELIAAISAPTSLALEVAERCGITLCAFVRETRATLFSHPHRLVDGEQS